jgi:hypothetical protein
VQIKRRFQALLVGLAAGLLAGCQNDEEIRHYQVPRPEEPPLNRLLGAIFPKGDQPWFFKLVGPAPLIEKHQAEFDRFVQSVRLSDKGDQPITWTAPEGWRPGPKNELRYATFYMGPEDNPLELTVSTSGGSLLENVNRWRRQLALGPLTETGLAQDTKQIQVEGITVTLVDMEGTGSGKTRMGGGAPIAGAASPHGGAIPSRPVRYSVPTGWQEEPPNAPRVAAFRIAEGNQSAEVTIIPFAGEAGGLVENVKRWRGEVGLGSIPTDELLKQVQPLTVDGLPAAYVDLLGPASAGEKRHTLAVMVPRGGQSWFIKMRGSADLVSKQKPTFETFVKSVRFEGDPGARP